MDSEEFTSRIPGFYNLSIAERQAHLARTLFPHLRTLLRRELRSDRERAGTLNDLHR